MLTVIPQVLDAATLVTIHQTLLAHEDAWQAGRQTAGSLAQGVKDNAQFSHQHPAYRDMAAMGLHALSQHPLF